jgi:hypothetical protein
LIGTVDAIPFTIPVGTPYIDSRPSPMVMAPVDEFTA